MYSISCVVYQFGRSANNNAPTSCAIYRQISCCWASKIGWMALGCVCMLFFYLLVAGCASTNQFTPVIYPAIIPSRCGQHDSDHLTTTLQQVKQQLTASQCCLANKISCEGILQHCPSTSSGYYYITAPDGSQVYRSIMIWTGSTVEEREAGWDWVAYVNMSESGTTCHEGLAQQTYSGLTLCGRNITAWPCWMPECNVLHTRSELFQSMWTTKRIPNRFTKCFLRDRKYWRSLRWWGIGHIWESSQAHLDICMWICSQWSKLCIPL